MIAGILATAAFLAAPLPPGRGSAQTAPLAVSSAPPGATVSARFRDAHGAERAAQCVAPCTLHIPRNAPLVLEVDLDGRPLRKPAVRWAGGFLTPARLEPAEIVARLP